MTTTINQGHLGLSFQQSHKPYHDTVWLKSVPSKEADQLIQWTQLYFFRTNLLTWTHFIGDNWWGHQCPESIIKRLNRIRGVFQRFLEKWQNCDGYIPGIFSALLSAQSPWTDSSPPARKLCSKLAFLYYSLMMPVVTSEFFLKKRWVTKKGGSKGGEKRRTERDDLISVLVNNPLENTTLHLMRWK